MAALWAVIAFLAGMGMGVAAIIGTALIKAVLEGFDEYCK